MECALHVIRSLEVGSGAITARMHAKWICHLQAEVFNKNKKKGNKTKHKKKT